MKIINTFIIIIMSFVTAASATTHSSLRRSVQAQNEEPYTYYCQSDEGVSTTCSDNMLVPECRLVNDMMDCNYDIGEVNIGEYVGDLMCEYCKLEPN